METAHQHSQGEEDMFPRLVLPTRSLFVHGVKVDKVIEVAEVSLIHMWFGQYAPLIRNFMTKHPIYISGIVPLLAFFRLFDRVKKFDHDNAGILRALNFLHLLVEGSDRDESEQPPDFWLEKLALLGLPSTGAEFEVSLFRLFYPHLGNIQLRQDGLMLKTFIKACHENGADSFRTAIRSYGGYHLAVTTKGYLGLVSPGVQPGAKLCECCGTKWMRKDGDQYIHVGKLGVEPGDIVYVLDDFHMPALLRKAYNGDHYYYVGQARGRLTGRSRRAVWPWKQGSTGVV